MADLTKHSSWISAALYSTVFADALRPQMIWCFSWPWMYISQLLLLHNQCGLLMLFGYLHLNRKRNPGSIRYILGGVIGLAPFNFLKRPATKYDI